MTVSSNWFTINREFKGVPLVGPTAVIVALAKLGTEIAKGEVLNEPVLTVVPSEMEYCRSTVLTDRVPIPEIRSDCAAERPVTLLMVKTSWRAPRELNRLL
jgi:hypothetical protein